MEDYGTAAPGRKADAQHRWREQYLGYRWCAIDKLGHRSDKLRWCEGLCQHDAVRDAFGRPIVSVLAAHVDDGKVRVDFSGVSGDIPAVDVALPKIDVGDKRSIFSLGCVKQLHGVFAGRSYCYLESPLCKTLFYDALNKMVVLNNQNNQ